MKNITEELSEGKNGITLAIVEKICDGFGIKYRDLFIELEIELNKLNKTVKKIFIKNILLPLIFHNRGPVRVI